MIEVRGYKCEFCEEGSLDKKAIEDHEDECTFNPRNRACDSCKNFKPNLQAVGYGCTDTCLKGISKELTLLSNGYPYYGLRIGCEEWELFENE